MAHEVQGEMEKAGFVHTNKRRHKLRRFAKAARAAHTLFDAATTAGDKRTAATAAIYADQATALELFEKV